jgi:hypothetical protein
MIRTSRMVAASAGAFFRNLSPRAGALILIVLGCAHRGAIFAFHLSALRRLIAANPDWLTWQFPPVLALSKHLAKSLLFLQQTPPVPALILGLSIKSASWPFGVAYLLIGLQAALSIGTAVLMFRIQLFFMERVYLALVAPTVFLLSADLLLLEYNSEGQTFYETFPMFLLTACSYLVFRLAETRRVKYSLFLGLVTALLALSRATFSYFFLVPLLLLIVLRPSPFSRHLLVFGLCGILPQLCWSTKNAILYDRFSLDTSSWAGIHAEAGLLKAGLGRVFLDSILEDPEAYPAWFIAMNRERGLFLWMPGYVGYVPQPVRDRDKWIQETLGGTGASTDSYGESIVSDLYRRAYRRFIVKQPAVVLGRFWSAYAIYWQPIRNYADGHFVQLFYVSPVLREPFAFGAVLNHLVRRDIPEKEYVMAGQWRFLAKPENPQRGSNWSLTVLPTLFWMRNILALHVLAPALLVFAAARRACRRKAELPLPYLFMLSAIGYVTLVANLAEFGENMRFRLSVEPIVWLASAFTLNILYGFFWPKRAASTGSSQDVRLPRALPGRGGRPIALPHHDALRGDLRQWRHHSTT